MKGGAEKPLWEQTGHHMGGLGSPQPRPSTWEKGQTALPRVPTDTAPVFQENTTNPILFS